MPIHTPPFHRYPLFDPWDKEAFAFLTSIGKTKSFPAIKGSVKDLEKYLVALIRTQKSLHDYRHILKDTLEQIKQSNTIDARLLHEKYPPESVGTETPAWVTYKEDKIVNDFIDSLAHKKITFVGSELEIAEFILRFILGQLGHDWESTILMIWEMLGEGEKLVLKEVNEQMKTFDYCELFG